MKKTIEEYSPDKRYKLTFYDFEEPRMGMNICKFFLHDLHTHSKIDFQPLHAMLADNLTNWSENLNYFSVPTINVYDNFFIYNLSKKEFTSIHFKNGWVLKGHLYNERIEIEFEESQIPERKEHNKYPTKNYLKPDNLTFNFNELKWIEFNKLKDFNNLNEKIKIYNLQPIDNGWRKFKGKLPETTEILVWELNEFAKYGDEQSKIWFNQIQAITDDINYWINASEYLGIKKRKKFLK